MRLGQFTVAIDACNDALRLDSTNSKALYRRAVARMSPASAGSTELDASIVDLQTAIRAHPDDETVARELRRLKGMRKRQRAADKKTFGGLFQRGEVVAGRGAPPKPLTEEQRRARKEEEEKRAAVVQQRQFVQQLAEMERVATMWEEEGKTEQAQELRQHIEKAKR